MPNKLLQHRSASLHWKVFKLNSVLRRAKKLVAAQIYQNTAMSEYEITSDLVRFDVHVIHVF
jgi:hypothetical protein